MRTGRVCLPSARNGRPCKYTQRTHPPTSTTLAFSNTTLTTNYTFHSLWAHHSCSQGSSHCLWHSCIHRPIQRHKHWQIISGPRRPSPQTTQTARRHIANAHQKPRPPSVRQQCDRQSLPRRGSMATPIIQHPPHTPTAKPRRTLCPRHDGRKTRRDETHAATWVVVAVIPNATENRRRSRRRRATASQAKPPTKKTNRHKHKRGATRHTLVLGGWRSK
jgi:hypothetical protein